MCVLSAEARCGAALTVRAGEEDEHECKVERRAEHGHCLVPSQRRKHRVHPHGHLGNRRDGASLCLDVVGIGLLAQPRRHVGLARLAKEQQRRVKVKLLVLATLDERGVRGIVGGGRNGREKRGVGGLDACIERHECQGLANEGISTAAATPLVPTLLTSSRAARYSPSMSSVGDQTRGVPASS